MKFEVLKSKLEVTVTESNKNNEESITIDSKLMYHADLMEHEKIDITCNTNNSRISTYITKGDRDSGIIRLNGNISKYFKVGDKINILSYYHFNPDFQYKLHPIIIETENNKFIKKRIL